MKKAKSKTNKQAKECRGNSWKIFNRKEDKRWSTHGARGWCSLSIWMTKKYTSKYKDMDIKV